VPCLYGGTYFHDVTHSHNATHSHNMPYPNAAPHPNALTRPHVGDIPTDTKHISQSRFQNQGKGTISAIIGSFKSVCTKTINKTNPKTKFAWQSGFYDSIIRDPKSLEIVRKYIRNNPRKWVEPYCRISE
jgi:hypothetical protein